MSGLLTTTGKRIQFMSFDLIAGETSTAALVRVIASDGAQLLSEANDDITFKAREHGTLDAYVDLASGIDLSGYTPDVAVDFDLICQASEDITGLFRDGFFVGVGSSGPAGWTL